MAGNRTNLWRLRGCLFDIRWIIFFNFFTEKFELENSTILRVSYLSDLDKYSIYLNLYIYVDISKLYSSEIFFLKPEGIKIFHLYGYLYCKYRSINSNWILKCTGVAIELQIFPCIWIILQVEKNNSIIYHLGTVMVMISNFNSFKILQLPIISFNNHIKKLYH